MGSRGGGRDSLWSLKHRAAPFEVSFLGLLPFSVAPSELPRVPPSRSVVLSEFASAEMSLHAIYMHEVSEWGCGGRLINPVLPFWAGHNQAGGPGPCLHALDFVSSKKPLNQVVREDGMLVLTPFLPLPISAPPTAAAAGVPPLSLAAFSTSRSAFQRQGRIAFSGLSSSQPMAAAPGGLRGRDPFGEMLLPSRAEVAGGPGTRPAKSESDWETGSLSLLFPTASARPLHRCSQDLPLGGWEEEEPEAWQQEKEKS